MIIVGFDWARDKHDVCVQNPAGKTVYSGMVKHNAEAFDRLRLKLAEFEPNPAAVHVAMEQHDGALLAWLLEAGYTVYGINPKSADRARDVFRPAGAKDDPGDALVAADVLRCNLDRFKPLHPQSEETLSLRSLARLRMRMTQQKTAVMQRLRALVAEWCPQVSRLCNDFNRSWQRALLQRWFLHEDLAAAHGNSINAFLSEHRLCPNTRDKIRAVQKAKPMFIPEGRKEAVRFEIGLCLEQLELLMDKLNEIDGQLETALSTHPSFRIFNSLPVKGLQTLSMITAAFGDRQKNPTGWRQLAARWGVGPVTVSSGKKKLVKRRRACDTHILQALTDFAFTTAFSVSGCWAFTFYQRKRNEGRDHHEALRAVALRWVKILWAMWNAGSVYSEAYHRRRKQRAG